MAFRRIRKKNSCLQYPSIILSRKFIKMKKALFLSIFFCSICLTYANVELVDFVEKQYIGTWLYEVPNAPDGYQDGSLIFEEKNDQLLGYVMIQGYKSNLENIRVNENQIKCSMYVEGTKVSFVLNFEKDTFSGKVTYTEGTIDISGKRKR